ncbi:MAG: hypothetical protein ACLFRF_00565 [Desulfobacterales bacterium]
MLAGDLPGVSAGPDLIDTTWRTRAQWQAANTALRYLMDRHAGRLDAVCEAAENLRYEFSALYPLLDRLCEMTCPTCEAPCCQAADPRFDLRDLLFMHFTNAAVPIGQPRGEGFTLCRYLGPSGCSLPRQSRPFICTWYICSSQKTLLNIDLSKSYAAIQDSIRTIKSYRKQLETRWLAVTN